MTKVTINPGVCGIITKVTASSEDQTEVVLKVESNCRAVTNMMKELGDTFNAYEICFANPGSGPFYQFASQTFQPHGACPTIAGIIKCAEAECKLALPADVSIKFEK